MFEAASRNKYRFPFRGGVSVEDLWDLTVQNLDSVYRELRGEQKNKEEESLLSTNNEDSDLSCKIDIVKHIVSVKQAEADERKIAAEKRAQKARIRELIAEKKDEALKVKSAEELEMLLEGM